MSFTPEMDDTAPLLEDFGTHSASKVAPMSTLATAMMFGSVLFAFAALAARSYLTGDLRPMRAAQNPRSTALDVRSFCSVYTLLHHLSVFSLILMYAYICEYHPPFPHANKSYDRDEFFFLTALLIIASAYTVSKNDKNSKNAPPEMNGKKHSDMSSDVRVEPVNEANEVLNRDQTEEWKGWMQFVFLMYHYYHAEEVYNAIRIMITCYVWMTGFGNFSFFYLRQDYSAVRVLQMLWRLNFLVVFLCLSQGTTYILYYICLLHTYFFLMVYVAMRIAKHVNYTKWGLRLKLGIVALIIFFVWDVDSGLFRLLHFLFLGETPMLGATSGSMWEWYFRSSLDHWSTFFGMIFALNFPITSLFYRKLEAQPLVSHVLAKGAVAVALLGAFAWWVTGPFQHGKLEYNATNAYFGFIPLITYVYFRNLTPSLRSYSLDLLHQIGKTTLETYLMQHHIWLTSDAKSLLTLIPGWPKVNMLLVTLIYYLCSRRLYQLTLFLRGMILPDDRAKCIRHLAAMGGMIGAFYALALALQSLGILSLMSVAIVAVVCGALLYQAVIDSSWEAHRESASSNPTVPSDASVIETMVVNGVSGSDSTVAFLSPPLIGAMVVLILGLSWQGMAQAGAGKIQLLPVGCEAFVNDGAWVPVDACNEEARGAGYRDYGITSFATCSPQTQSFVWGWNETQSSSHCRFVRRDAKSLRNALQHRTVTFIGDSITRHIYYATLRTMGMAGAGSYNTNIPKWSDMTNTVDQSVMEFEWAALATDQVGKLRDILKRPMSPLEGSTQAVRPDILVLGGGAWDRLHVFATDEDRESHRSTVRELAKEMRLARSAGIPVVWIVPTTINTPALLTEEKQKNIKESDMEAMRALYSSLGVLEAASFVLDGPAFTMDRVSESYDGVHYPLSVYEAGAQILSNSLDWLLAESTFEKEFAPPSPGAMSKPLLGMMMLCFVFVGLVFFDGFMGFFYVASLFSRGVMPIELYEEAFSSLHEQKNLPEIELTDDFSSTDGASIASRSFLSARSVKGGKSNRSAKSSESSVDEEIAALLGTTGKGQEMSSNK